MKKVVILGLSYILCSFSTSAILNDFLCLRYSIHYFKRHLSKIALIRELLYLNLLYRFPFLLFLRFFFVT